MSASLKRFIAIIPIVLLISASGIRAQGRFSEHLDPLEPFVGKTWKGTMVSHEYITGNANGITEVKAIGTIRPDGKLHSKFQYLKDGLWIDGHEILYEEDPTAKVIFR